MIWLVWREYRQNRLILITGAVLLLLPYLVALIGFLWMKAPTNGAPPVAAAFGVAAIYSVVLSQLTVALLGGNAIAGERADRSAEFIAYLPLRRTRLLVAKLSVAVFTVALIWGLNSFAFWIFVTLVPEARAAFHSSDGGAAAIVYVYYIAITGLVFYSVSWLISSFQSSPTFAVGGGLITPMILFMGFHAAAWSMGVDVHETGQYAGVAYATICPVLAVVCFSIGTWYYLNRVEP